MTSSGESGRRNVRLSSARRTGRALSGARYFWRPANHARRLAWLCKELIILVLELPEALDGAEGTVRLVVIGHFAPDELRIWNCETRRNRHSLVRCVCIACGRGIAPYDRRFLCGIDFDRR